MKCTTETREQPTLLSVQTILKWRLHNEPQWAMCAVERSTIWDAAVLVRLRCRDRCTLTHTIAQSQAMAKQQRQWKHIVGVRTAWLLTMVNAMACCATEKENDGAILTHAYTHTYIRTHTHTCYLVYDNVVVEDASRHCSRCAWNRMKDSSQSEGTIGIEMNIKNKKKIRCCRCACYD